MEFCSVVLFFSFSHHTIVLPQLQVSNNYQKVWVWYFMQLLIAPPPLPMLMDKVKVGHKIQSKQGWAKMVRVCRVLWSIL